MSPVHGLYTLKLGAFAGGGEILPRLKKAQRFNRLIGYISQTRGCDTVGR